MMHRLRFFVRTTLAFAAVSMALWGQGASTSQVAGDVRDAQGAAVPEAQITLTQKDTGLVRTAMTQADGSYLFPNLPIGPYEMRVTKAGFETYVRAGIVLEVNTNPTIHVTLTV